MKKKLFAVMLAVVATLSLTACSKTGTCDFCGKENVKVRDIKAGGETGWFCDDCYDGVKALAELASALQ